MPSSDALVGIPLVTSPAIVTSQWEEKNLTSGPTAHRRASTLASGLSEHHSGHREGVLICEGLSLVRIKFVEMVRAPSRNTLPDFRSAAPDDCHYTSCTRGHTCTVVCAFIHIPEVVCLP